MKALVPSVVLWDREIADKDRLVPRDRRRENLSYRDRCEVKFADVDCAWESDNGVYLKSTRMSAGHGAVAFFPEPHATALREAIGDNMSKSDPGKYGQ